MMDKKQSRLRRARQTRAKIAELKVNRLAVHRTNLHIYASIIGPDARVLVSASTLEAEVRQELAGCSRARVATLPPPRWSASAWQRRHCKQVLPKLRSIARVSVTTAVSRRWPKPRVKPV